MHIGIVPARAGSKRFPCKNKAMLCGTPLYQRAIKLSQSILDRTIISTDDIEIQNNAECEVHIRPKELATGEGYRIDDVIINMVSSLSIQKTDIIHIIQCTSPFIRYNHIISGMMILSKFKTVDSVQLVAKIPNIFHAYSQRTIVDNRIMFKYPDERIKCYNSQLKPEHYAFCGYVGLKVSSLLKHNNIWGRESVPIIGETNCLVDIDFKEDLEYASFILTNGGEQSACGIKETEACYCNSRTFS